ncbi:MAG: hypothetical protein ABFS12_18540 [Bacteroidota bacterium]
MYKGFLIHFSFFVFLFLTIIGCQSENEAPQIGNEGMLEIALYNKLHHFQSKTERNLFRENNIRSVSFVRHIVSESKVDSATFLKIDEKGRIISKTTNECTTVGCLPYTIRQDYEYDNDKIIRMDDFTFKKKYKNILSYWNENDTSKLSKFEWEDYSYKNDTTIVESATQRWIYTYDLQGRVMSKFTDIKMNEQYIKVNYSYEPVKIKQSLINDYMKSYHQTEYVISSPNTVTYTDNYNTDKVRKKLFIFNINGLLSNIKGYLNDTLMVDTKISYDTAK